MNAVIQIFLIGAFVGFLLGWVLGRAVAKWSKEQTNQPPKRTP